MNLADHHCESLSLFFAFSAEDFDKESFLKEAGIEDESKYIDEDGDFSLATSLPSRDESSLHAHLTILIRANGSGRANFDFHIIGPNEVSDEPPYLEDAPQWFAQFFKKEITSARVNTFYFFDNKFETVIPLPFPLVATNEKLTGLKVSGLALTFPSGSPIESCILQKEREDFYLNLRGKPQVKLKEFDLTEKMDELSEVVASLIKEKSNGAQKTTQT